MPKSRRQSKQKLAYVERLLERRRGKKYVDAMTRLDLGSKMQARELAREIVTEIETEMEEIAPDMRPKGIVSQCFLGAPYEVHTLDVGGIIIEHYETHRVLPDGLERARKLAVSGKYAFIEVYDGALRAIGFDGSVATLKE